MPTDARDKAVDEAIGALDRAYVMAAVPSVKPTLNLLWQRAQEAERARYASEEADAALAVEDLRASLGLPEDTPESIVVNVKYIIEGLREAEREENCKAVCGYCREGQPFDGEVHLVKHKGRTACVHACGALAIRNRAARASHSDDCRAIYYGTCTCAARASEEPKP